MNQQFEASERKNNIFVRAEARKLFFLPMEEVNTGILERSVLGPLLFLVYINDLTDLLSSNAKLFADDTSLFSVIHVVDTFANELNNYLYQ